MTETDPDIIETIEPTESDPPQILSLQFEAQAFVQHLASYDLTEAQRLVYIETISRIVLQFVDPGFGVHPIQQAQQNRREGREVCCDPAASLLELSPSTNLSEPRRARNPARGTVTPAEESAEAS